MQTFWRTMFRMLYRMLAALDTPIRGLWRSGTLGITVDLIVVRKGGSGSRSRLVGLLRSDGQQYVGHPNGDVGWTRDLEAAGEATLRWPNGNMAHVNAQRLSFGPERTAAIRATSQHPFPGNLIYRLARTHVTREGVFFRLDAA